jgi:hypothetical protein
MVEGPVDWSMIRLSPARDLRLPMDQMKSFHVLTIGSNPLLIRNLWDRVAARGEFRISHLVHPCYDRSNWPQNVSANDVHFFRNNMRSPNPPADLEFLSTLERGPVPTIHNMIMSDRLTAKLPYHEVIPYAGTLAQRLAVVYEATDPTVVIGAFDGLHNSLGLAVANNLGIPWFALLFSPLPGDEAAFCSNLSPASRVNFEEHRAAGLHDKAENLLSEFEGRKLAAVAYLPPKLFSAAFIVKQIPTQLHTLLQVLRRRPLRPFLRFTDYPQSYSVRAMVGEAFRQRRNLWLLRRRRLLHEPVQKHFVFLGLHMQPESSIDVFAHFFSNQERIIELIARSIPPTHSILVKLHKSDTPNYSTEQLARLARFPGVELVSPYADTIEFIKRADLVFAIQGTIGLEGALLGKPVIMFGDSPVKIFPSVSTFSRTIDLPTLVRNKLAERSPTRSQIVAAFAEYLAPFYQASGNDWRLTPTHTQIADYVKLFELLRKHVTNVDIGVSG